MQETTTHILVIANDAVEGRLHETIRVRADARNVDLLVIAPAPNSRLRHWLSDEDGARRGATYRLVSWLEFFEREGIKARGWVGDPDPLQAIGDGLHVFPADEVAIATRPEGRPHRLTRDLVGRARARYALPIYALGLDDAAVPQPIAA